LANDPVNADRGVRPNAGRWSRCWPTTLTGLLANSGSALTALLATTAISVDWVVGQHRDQRWLGRWGSLANTAISVANTAISVDWVVGQHRDQR